MRDSELKTKYPILRRGRREPPAAPEIVVVNERAHYIIRMGWLCRLTVAAFGAIYAATLLWNGIGLIIQFGTPVPLAGVTLVVIGLPWTLGAAMFPDQWQPLAAALAPGLTLLILYATCRKHHK